MKKYSVTFLGYRLDAAAGSLPSSSGIYMIYRCVYNKLTRRVKLVELFYIGQAYDLNDEINYHERHQEFLEQASSGEQICYAYARVEKASLNIIENALVYMQKPRLNTNLTDYYNYEDAEFQIEGKCQLLKFTHFSIAGK